MMIQSPVLGPGQYHLAVAGGCAAVKRLCYQRGPKRCAPTRYREVVLTRPKLNV